MSADISFPAVGWRKDIIVFSLKNSCFWVNFTYTHAEGFWESYHFKMLSIFCRWQKRAESVKLPILPPKKSFPSCQSFITRQHIKLWGFFFFNLIWLCSYCITSIATYIFNVIHGQEYTSSLSCSWFIVKGLDIRYCFQASRKSFHLNSSYLVNNFSQVIQLVDVNIAGCILASITF